MLGPLEDILARKDAGAGGKGPVAPPAGAMGGGGRDPHKPKSLGARGVNLHVCLPEGCQAIVSHLYILLMSSAPINGVSSTQVWYL